MELLQNSDFSWHTEQPDVPQKSAAQMKAFFDAPTHTLMQKTNELIERINTLLGDENTQGSVAYDIRKAIGMVTDFDDIVTYLEQNGGEAADLLAAVRELQTLVGESSVTDQIAASRADYVTETGSDGKWTYKKWASGTYEAGCCYTEAVTIEPNGNSFYGHAAQITAPSFSKTVTNCISNNSVQGVESWGTSVHWDNNISPKVYTTYLAENVTARICIRIDGTWK